MSESIEFGSKSAADTFRDQYTEHLCTDDDKRTKTVTFTSDAPDHVVEQAERAALDAAAERENTAGQIPLSDRELDEIDFSRSNANVLHAQAVKGIAADAGVDDWLAHYDPTLTVDEHRDIMEQAAREDKGQRMDSEDSAVVKAGQASRRAQAEECNHAEDHCRHGDADACEFLTDVCGFEDDEIDQIMQADDREDLPGEVYGALRQLWQRYQIGISNAKEAAAAINEINAQHRDGLTEFEELGDREITRRDINWRTEA